MLEMHSIGELLIWYFGIAMSGKTSSECLFICHRKVEQYFFWSILFKGR